MLGITEIGTYIPANRLSNLSRADKFGYDEDFFINKLGVEKISIKDETEDVAAMCLKAFDNLTKKVNWNSDELDVIILVTQNPDRKIPHTSAIIHGELGVKEDCACFDISLGCSGFVYGLSVIELFMEGNNLNKGLLFTCDPYSKIIDPDDKNTTILFGDAAAVTLITRSPKLSSGRFNFGTIGKEFGNLVCGNDENLFMNGRGIFNFAARYIPGDLEVLLEKNKIAIDEIDRFVFHQGSKYIIDTLTRIMRLPGEKVINDILFYGNTVSSSIPIILEKELSNTENNIFYICGFGVGLSWSSTILKRVQ